ncbi:MAG: hypothetical protein R2849_07330 [Thermomicrobiales bacterium]
MGHLRSPVGRAFLAGTSGAVPRTVRSMISSTPGVSLVTAIAISLSRLS